MNNRSPKTGRIPDEAIPQTRESARAWGICYIRSAVRFSSPAPEKRFSAMWEVRPRTPTRRNKISYRGAVRRSVGAQGTVVFFDLCGMDGLGEKQPEIWTAQSFTFQSLSRTQALCYNTYEMYQRPMHLAEGELPKWQAESDWVFMLGLPYWFIWFF